MTFIIDASMAAAWLLPEEFSTEAEDVIGSIAASCPIPSLFWFEIRNILAMSERRGRIGAGDALIGMARVRRQCPQRVGTHALIDQMSKRLDILIGQKLRKFITPLNRQHGRYGIKFFRPRRNRPIISRHERMDPKSGYLAFWQLQQACGPA